MQNVAMPRSRTWPRISPGIGGEASTACSLRTGEAQCPLGPAGQRPKRTHVWPLPQQDKGGEHGRPWASCPQSCVAGETPGWELTTWHRPGPLSVAEVAGQGLELGLDGQRALHRRNKGNPAAPARPQPRCCCGKVLKGYEAHMAKEPKGHPPPGPQVWAATTPSWPATAYSDAEGG